MAFKDLRDKEIPNRIILATEGERGSGKTDFTYSAARRGPVYVLMFDIAASEGVERAAKKVGLDVHISEFPIDPVRDLGIQATDFATEKGDKKDLQAEAKKAGSELLDQFDVDFEAAVRRASAENGTVAVTTATELYELIRLAWYGKVSQVPQLGYPAINSKIKHYVSLAAASDCNLIFEHQLKDEWVGNDDNKKRTGKLIRSGASTVEYTFPVILQMYRKGTKTDPDRVEGEQETAEFYVRFAKCNLNAGLVGVPIQVEQSLTGFDVIGDLIFEGEW